MPDDAHVLVVDAAPDCVIVMDERGALRELNRAAERAFGHRREAAVGRLVGDLIVPPHLRAAHAAGLARLLATGESRLAGRRLETEGLRADGSTFPIELTIEGISAGGERLFVAYARDITERTRVRRALLESEARFQAAADSLADGLAIFDADGRLAYHNRRFADHLMPGVRAVLALGRRLEDMVREGMAGAPVYHEDMGPDFLGRRLALRELPESDHEQHLADGRWMRVRESRMSDGGRVMLMSDITARKEAEAALKASEARLVALMEHAPLIIHLKDREGRYLLANPECAKLFGRDPALVVGLTPFDLLPPETAAEADRVHREVVETGRTLAYEEYDPRVGGYNWTHTIRFPVRDRDGRVAVVGCIALDITERKRAEEALKASEARLAAFMEHAPVGMYLKDLDGRYLVANPEMAKVFGRPVGEVLGRTVEGLFAAEEVEAIQARDREVLEGGVATVHEEHLPDLDAYAWSMVIRFPVRDGSGAVTHVGGFDVDITPRKRAERALMEGEARFRAIVEDQTELISRYDANFRCTFSNAADARLLGETPEGMVGSDLFRSIPEPARSRLRAELLALTPENPVYRGENEKVLPGGEVRWFEWADRALFDAEGRLTGYQSVGRDVTGRRRAEEEIARQREALHQQEKLGALGSLLAGVAHELNNPLAVVVGRAIMLEEEAGDPGTAASLARLRAAAERCAKIVKTFLAMARQKPRERRRVAVGAVLEAALDMVAYGLRSAGIEVARDLAADLPEVLADEDQLHQVFLNLLVNAQQALRDAPPPRRVVVSTRREGALVRVEVADTGPGVPAADRRRIFEPFFTTKPTGFGTGIGLSVCHAVVAAHEGSIEAGERPGGGALFTVRLPAAPAGEAEVAAPGAAPGPPRPARVLVVDDEPEILAMLGEILARDGHAVELAASGRDALRRLEGRGFDLVISDLRMPDVDGRELHRVLRARHPELAARMILLTGDTLGTTLAELPGLDHDALLEKPVEPAAVRRAVRRRLAAGRPSGGAP